MVCPESRTCLRRPWSCCQRGAKSLSRAIIVMLYLYLSSLLVQLVPLSLQPPSSFPLLFPPVSLPIQPPPSSTHLASPHAAPLPHPIPPRPTSPQLLPS